MADTIVDFIGPVQITVNSEQVSDGPGGMVVVDLSPGAGGSDVGASLFTAASPEAARETLGVNIVPITLFLANILASGAAVYRVIAPVAGEIDKAYLVASATIATGNLDVSLAINGVAVTDGDLRLATGAVPGISDDSTPSAAKTVALGDVISATVGGGNTAAGTGSVMLLITLA